MTSELRPALAVWQEAYGVWGDPSLPDTSEADQAAAAVIEAYGDQREAKWKALAETLAGALGLAANRLERNAVDYIAAGDPHSYEQSEWADETRQALTSYKEQRDD